MFVFLFIYHHIKDIHRLCYIHKYTANVSVTITTTFSPILWYASVALMTSGIPTQRRDVTQLHLISCAFLSVIKIRVHVVSRCRAVLKIRIYISSCSRYVLICHVQQLAVELNAS